MDNDVYFKCFICLKSFYKYTVVRFEVTIANLHQLLNYKGNLGQIFLNM